MRLFVQGCLILAGLLFSFVANASNIQKNSAEEALSACLAYASTYGRGPHPTNCTEGVFNGWAGYVSYSGYQCPDDECSFAMSTHVWYAHDPQYEPCNPPDYWDNVKKECVRIQTPEECFEIGKAFNPASGQCTLACPNGQLNGQCLEKEESACDHHSSDFIGYAGPGGSAICGNSKTECEAAGGQFGIFNGSAMCISSDYGPPVLCEEGQISVFDSYGFTCSALAGGDNNPQWEGGEPNEDTDGDGIPDRFNPNLVNSSEMLQIVGGNIFNQNNHIINQNNITNHNLTNINNSVNNLNQTINQQGEQANQNLEGIAGILGQIAGDVSDIATNGIPGTGDGSGGDGGDGTGDGTGEGEGVELGTIEGLLGDANSKQDDTNTKLDKIIDGEEGGLSTQGLGNAPEFSDSIGRLQTAFFDHPTIQKVTTLPSLAEGSSCPVFTIPANAYWDSLTMDMHCTVFEDYRGMLSGMFLFFWTVLAIFAFLRA